VKVYLAPSPVHGTGVFARYRLQRGSTVIEYAGPRLTAAEADAEGATAHTVFFLLRDGRTVIRGANEARFINHSCAPNVDSRERKGRVWIYALRNIAPGEELLLDYNLTIGGRVTAKLKKEYPCRCGAVGCRGTLLSVK
jgi:uncharacterized protein